VSFSKVVGKCFYMDVNEITPVYLGTVWPLEVKNAVIEFVYCVTD
jgi:hypothetical protein